MSLEEISQKQNNNDIARFLELSRRVNSKAVTLTRCLILVLIGYSLDGIQYRELKATLRISDGRLIANLNQLTELGYIRKSEVELDRRKLDVYFLTDEGKDELKTMKQFIGLLLEVLSKTC